MNALAALRQRLDVDKEINPQRAAHSSAEKLKLATFPFTCPSDSSVSANVSYYTP